MPRSILRLVDEHAEQFPPVPVTLPWRTPAGEPATARLLLADEREGALRRNHFNESVWAPARKAAGVENPTRQDGTHALRHYYASVLLDAGRASGRCRSTWDTTILDLRYGPTSHLMPSSSARTRRAVDTVFGEPSDEAAIQD